MKRRDVNEQTRERKVDELCALRSIVRASEIAATEPDLGKRIELRRTILRGAALRYAEVKPTTADRSGMLLDAAALEYARDIFEHELRLRGRLGTDESADILRVLDEYIAHLKRE